jgi:hypothetical protein
MQTNLARLSAVLIISGMLAAGPAFADKDTSTPEAFKELLTTSQVEKKGLTFYVKGATIAAVVTKFDDKTVEGRSQTHDKIVIRLDRVDAIAQ